MNEGELTSFVAYIYLERSRSWSVTASWSHCGDMTSSTSKLDCWLIKLINLEEGLTGMKQNGNDFSEVCSRRNCWIRVFHCWFRTRWCHGIAKNVIPIAEQPPILSTLIRTTENLF